MRGSGVLEGGKDVRSDCGGTSAHRGEVQLREIWQDAVLVEEDLEGGLHLLDVGLGDKHGGDADTDEAGWVGRLAVVRER